MDTKVLLILLVFAILVACLVLVFLGPPGTAGAAGPPPETWYMAEGDRVLLVCKSDKLAVRRLGSAEAILFCVPAFESPLATPGLPPR